MKPVAASAALSSSAFISVMSVISGIKIGQDGQASSSWPKMPAACCRWPRATSRRDRWPLPSWGDREPIVKMRTRPGAVRAPRGDGCGDVLAQRLGLAAGRPYLTGVWSVQEAAVHIGAMEDHLAHCVTQAAAEGGEVATGKVREASEAIARLVRS